MKSRICTVSLAGSLLLVLLVSACSRSAAPAAADTTNAEASQSKKEEGIKAAHSLILDHERREKIGIATTRAPASIFLAESGGYGVVLGHEAIAVAGAEVATAQAAARQSGAALARTKQLAGTPGALPAETLDAAERQSAADAAALALAERRLTALLGQNAPLNGDEPSLLTGLATGRVKLVRATFPLGALGPAVPKRLRIARLDVTSGARSWTGTLIWDAPADATIPGRNYFTLLRATDVGEGERLQVWASTGATVRGATVPASAIVQSNSAYWCYIEKPEGSFTRTAIDTSRSVTGGYFVDEGVTAGDAVVTAGAGLLLARETNPSTAAE